MEVRSNATVAMKLAGSWRSFTQPLTGVERNTGLSKFASNKACDSHVNRDKFVVEYDFSITK